MDEEIQILNKKIKELEQENKQLKEKGLLEISNFNFLFNIIKQPIFILKANKNDNLPKISNINNSGCELIEYSNKEYKNQSAIELGLLNSEEQYLKIINSLASGESITYLGKIKPNNQQVINSELTLYYFLSGDFINLLILQRNVGTQQKVVEALRQSEYRFLQMAENITEGITIIENNKVVFVNSSMCKITGYNKEQLKDMDEYSISKPQEVEQLKIFKQKIENSKNVNSSIEFWINTKSGQEKCIRNSYTSYNDNGQQTMYIITSDITTSKRVNQALKKSQNEFKMLAENSPDLITRYDKDLTYIYANKTVERITNIPLSQIIGKNNIEIELDSDVVSFLEDMHLEVFRTGKTIKFEYRLTIDEKSYIFQAHLVPELSSNGNVESVLNVSRDITQIKNIERKLKEDKQEILEDNFLISQNLIKWGQKLCTNDNPNLSDDIKMTPILHIAEWTNYRYKQNNIILKNIKVNDFIKDIFNKNAVLIGNNNIETSLLIPNHDIKIVTDEELLSNTLTILLENAIESTKEGKIEIGYDIYNDKEIVFFVKDTGLGINPDDTEHIFEPFVSIGKDNHAGLGLSIAEKNVTNMNGVIWCLSAQNTGSTFCFTHPAQIEKSLRQSKSNENNESWKDKNVLVVEDSDTNYLLIEALLSNYGVNLTRAENGKDAIQIVKDNDNYDLILMDIQLPDINGYDATIEIRKFNTKIPIIAQTAYAMYDSVVKALKVGCNDFIAKPIKTKKLLNLISKYL
jgi:PAS domain S-box-containing protein